MLTIACLICFIAVGFIAQPGESLLSIPEIRIDYDQDDFSFLIMDDDEFEYEDEEMALIFGETGIDQTEDQLEREEREEEPSDTFSIVLAAVATIILFIAVLLIRKSHRPENQFEDYDDVMEEAPAILDGISKKRKRKFNFGVNYTIRRLFKRKVREYIITKGIYTQKSDTPKKLSETIGEWEDIRVLEQLYHKARYSGENVKRTELNVLKRQ